MYLSVFMSIVARELDFGDSAAVSLDTFECLVCSHRNNHRGLLYNSISGTLPVSGSFERMSGCHLFQRPPNFGAASPHL
jgi:hypothetical protein